MRNVMKIAAALSLTLLLPSIGWAQPTPEQLKRMSLEQLLNIDVTTVSRGPEPTMRVPAAVYIITSEDIRRSGARSFPELLRLAPGLQVARINAGTWAIGMRGFGDRLARSVLVLIDGRAVYSPLFAGTYWETQDMLLDDVDRIEIIPGPGGTLWGANAVNGIINIITKSASETTGIVALAGAGARERAFAAVRYGARGGEGWYYRVYAKSTDRTSQEHPQGLEFDKLFMGQGGFRADWSDSNGRAMTLQGDVYGARLGERSLYATNDPPFMETKEMDAPLSGGNALFRWNTPVGRSRAQLQTSYTRTNRDELPVGESRDTADADFQLVPPAWQGHHLTLGAGYRVTSGRIRAVAPTALLPSTRTDSLLSAFAQDEFELAPDRLRLTVGSKFEHNDYSGFELQPTVRILWTPDPDQSVWSAVTRAVRTPSRVETDYTTTGVVDPTVPIFLQLNPNPAFKSEKLVAYEAGYRRRLALPAYVSVSGFYNRLDDVLSTEAGAPVVVVAPAGPRLIIPLVFGNGLEGESYGAEFSGDVRYTNWWRGHVNYSYVHIDMSKKPDSLDVSQVARNEGRSPRHQLQIQTSIDVADAWALEGFVRHISKLPDGTVPAYTTFNLSALWRLGEHWNLTIVGQDLAQTSHVEWPDASFGIRRNGYVKLTWRR